MDSFDPTILLALIAAHKWVAVAALVIGAIVRLLKADVPPMWLNVPSKVRPWLALGLGIASGVLEKVVAGTPWKDAIIGGLVSGTIAIVGHDALIESLREPASKLFDFLADKFNGGGGSGTAVGIVFFVIGLGSPVFLTGCPTTPQQIIADASGVVKITATICKEFIDDSGAPDIVKVLCKDDETGATYFARIPAREWRAMKAASVDAGGSF